MIPASAPPPPADRRATGGGASVAFCLSCAGLTLARVIPALSTPSFVPPVLVPALAGLAAAGLAVWLFPARFPEERSGEHDSRATLLLGLSLLVLWGLLFALGRVPPGTAGGVPWWAAAIPVFTALPFFCGGIVVTGALTLSWTDVVRASARLFAGAALGAAAAPALIAWIGPFAALAALGAAASLASLRPSAVSRRRRAFPLLAAVSGIALAVATVSGGFAEPRYAAGRHVAGVRLDLRDGAARLLVHELDGAEARSAVAVGSAFSGALPELLGLVDDAGQRSTIVRVRTGEEPAWARASLVALPFRLRERPATLILGAGGGTDVLIALAAGAGPVRAVEGAPLALRAAQKDLADFSGRPYALAGVEAVVEDARAHLGRDGSRYDIVLAAGVDMLPTLEGIGAALDRLEDGGILAIARVAPGMPLQRLVASVRASLEARRSPAPAAHVFIAAAGSSALLIAKAALFTVEEVLFLERVCRESGFPVLYSPLRPGTDILSRLLKAEDPVALAAGLAYDVTPASDDRPSAGSFLRGRDLLRAGAPTGAGLADRALFAARDLTAVCFSAALAVLLLPLAAQGADRKARRGSWAAGAFFAALGLGLAVTGVILFERLRPLTGRPGCAAAVALAAFLAAGALGVRGSGPWAGSPTHLRRRLALLTIVLLLAAAMFPLIIELGLPLSPAMRLLLASAVAASLGTLAAQPLALGFAVAVARGEGGARRAWSVTAVFAALGAAGVLGVAAVFGETNAMLVGPACFLVAGALAEVVE